MFTLLIRPNEGTAWLGLKPKPVRWTRNLPQVNELVPGGQSVYLFPVGEYEWNCPDEYSSWLEQSLQLKIRLKIQSSAESESHQVDLIDAESDVCFSTPPHLWLEGSQ